MYYLYLLAACLLDLLLSPEDGNDMVTRNVFLFSTELHGVIV
jgi:hypothetical protein